MPELPKQRKEIERMLARRIATIHRDIRKRISGPDPAQLAPTSEEEERRKWLIFWPLYVTFAIAYNNLHNDLGSQQLRDATPSDENELDGIPERQGIILPPADKHEVKAARKWAERTASELSAGMARTEAKRAARAKRAIAKINSASESPDGVAKAKISKTEARARTRREINDAIDDIYGPKRTARVSATEVTRAISAGEMSYSARLKRNTGAVVYRVWQTERDDKVCPICTPLNGQRSEVYGPRIGAPPAHVNCRCWEIYKIARRKRRGSQNRPLVTA